MFTNLKLSTKLWGLTGLLLVAVLMVAGNSYWSISGIFTANEDFATAAKNSEFMVAKEVDHYKWLKQVEELFLKNASDLKVQMDHTKCGLGKFLHGEAGKKLAELDPKLAGSLEALKEPHKHLHDSAAHIKEVWRQNHVGLSLTLAARLDDHRRWAGAVANALLEGNEVNVQTDPTKCAFGKWLAGDECRTLKTEWPEFAAIVNKLDDHHKKLHAHVITLNNESSQEGKAKVYTEKIEHELKEVAGLFGQIQKMEGELDSAQAKAHRVFDTETIPALTATQAGMKALGAQLHEMELASKARMLSVGSTSKTTAGVVTVVSVLAGILLSFFAIRSITKPVKRIISGLNEGADQVASAAGQVSTASQALAEGSSEQAASIEETSSSLEEMSSMTQQNADHANEANNLMLGANNIVRQANESMGGLTTSMEEISKASQETFKIIKTIDEIAFQTNLLALNAAVEAARAGEAGAGFAVVADEVRNLAMRAADAANNTAALIEGTVKKVTDGSDLVAKTNEDFTQVAESAAKVGELVAEIAAASKEQAEGIGQVNQAVTDMDKVVQQNAANAEENASASEEMNAQAEGMKGFVSELVTIVDGAGKKNRHDRPVPVAHSPQPARRESLTQPSNISEKRRVTIGQTREVRSEQIIPLDDRDFSDF